jgi:hypothetical protein
MLLPWRGIPNHNGLGRISQESIVFSSSPAGFGKFIAGEIVNWGKLIRAVNIKPD